MKNIQEENELYSRSDKKTNTGSFNPSSYKEKKHNKSGAYKYINSKSIAMERKIRKKMLIKRITAVCCTLAILTATVAVVSAIKSKEREEAASAEAAAQESVYLPENLYVSSEPEEPESDMPVYETDKEFVLSTDKFSKDDIYDLNKTITSGFVVLYDMTTDEVLFSKNGSKKCFPASTTKMLTAITASRIITDPETKITVGKEIELIGEDSSTACLEKGMVLTFEMLIDALMLPSGNDAAYTIAVNCGRIYSENDKLSDKEAVKVFMDLVNDAARQIGAENTHFVTPDGWHDDNHYTTAEDLCKIAAYLKTVPIVNKSCSKPYVKWELIKGGTIEWYNSNKLLFSGSGLYSQYCDGVKTGFTDEAGTSVVASSTINGHTMIAAVMNGQTLYTKYDDVNHLFKKAFDLYSLNYSYDGDKEKEAYIAEQIRTAKEEEKAKQLEKEEKKVSSVQNETSVNTVLSGDASS